MPAANRFKALKILFFLKVTVYIQPRRQRSEKDLHAYGFECTDRSFRPIQFSSYGNLKVILETTFQRLYFLSFISRQSHRMEHTIMINKETKIQKYTDTWYKRLQ